MEAATMVPAAAISGAVLGNLLLQKPCSFYLHNVAQNEIDRMVAVLTEHGFEHSVHDDNGGVHNLVRGSLYVHLWPVVDEE